jgi:hypothetical protein
MTGTIVALALDKGYNSQADKGKPFTTIRLDGNRDSEFTVAGEIGKLGAKVEITAKLVE